jgi:hypothetical protein
MVMNFQELLMRFFWKGKEIELGIEDGPSKVVSSNNITN